MQKARYTKERIRRAPGGSPSRCGENVRGKVCTRKSNKRSNSTAERDWCWAGESHCVLESARDGRKLSQRSHRVEGAPGGGVSISEPLGDGQGEGGRS